MARRDFEGVDAVDVEVVYEANRWHGEQDALECFASVLEGHGAEVDTIEIEEVKDIVDDGDARLGTGDLAVAAEVDALLEQLERRHPALIEGDDLAVED